LRRGIEAKRFRMPYAPKGATGIEEEEEEEISN
jgi:hypothetical protein